jgi:ubiquinone biosynthesis protein COQ4
MLSTYYRKARAAIACIDYIREPTGQSAFQIAEGLRDSPDLRRAVARMREDPEIDALFREGHLRGFPDIDALAKLPEGTLGHEYAKMMRAANLSYDVFPRVRIADDATFYTMRARETHDVWHLVTGFGTDYPGESGLQAFQLAQLQVPVSKVLIGLKAIRAVFHPESLHPVFDAIARGWQMGRAARQLIGQRWEDGWDRPIQAWRKSLGLSVLADGRSAQ